MGGMPDRRAIGEQRGGDAKESACVRAFGSCCVEVVSLAAARSRLFLLAAMRAARALGATGERGQ